MSTKLPKIITLLLILLLIVPMVGTRILGLQLDRDTFTPKELSSPLNNPYMGWAPSADGGPYEQPHRLVYANVTWRELEPSPGQIVFDGLEKRYHFREWKKDGVKIILRINMDYPGEARHLDIPDWLYQEIHGDGTWYNLEYGQGFSPNYSNPTLIARHQAMIKALAGRYNGDSLIAFIALGSIGHWGEWHTTQTSEIQLPFPPIGISDQYVQHYISSFTNKLLLMRRPFQTALENRMGLYNDSFGDTEQTDHYFIRYFTEGYYDYFTEKEQPAMPDFWKTAPSGGEISNPPGLECFRSTQLDTTLRQLQESHTSWLGPFCPANESYGSSLQEGFDRVLRTMGYRFVLHSVQHAKTAKPGHLLKVSMEWGNDGVAPFYFQWPLELSLEDSQNHIAVKTVTSEDIRTWLPGRKETIQTLDIPKDLPEGRYTLCAAILDPDTGRPGIDLAIGGRRPDGRYRLDQINVTR